MPISLSTFTVSPDLSNRYNAAAWIHEHNQNTMLLLREVMTGNVIGEPDLGNIVLLELDSQGGMVNHQVIWEYQGQNHLLEDPRALVQSDGRILLGLTAVDSQKYAPYPAITTISSSTGVGDLTNIRIIKEFGPGKNTTPIDPETFIFRRNGEENNHQLLVFGFDGQNVFAKGDIIFSKNIPWAKWRIGTTMPPIWINKKEALMIIHGITMIDGKFVYSLGRAKLTMDANDFSVEVDPLPLITPDDFLDINGNSLIEELHPELRRVVYACGGVLKKADSKVVLSLFVNVGDRQTVEVQLPWKQLIEGWWVN